MKRTKGFLLFILLMVLTISTVSAGDGTGLGDAVLEIGTLYAEGNWQAVLDLPDTSPVLSASSDERYYKAYLSYMKGKAAEQAGRRETAAGHYLEVRALEQGNPSSARLLTLLADISLFPWLVFDGNRDQAASVLSEIFELEVTLDILVRDFSRIYGLTPPDKQAIRKRISEVKEPYTFVLKVGNRELTGISLEDRSGPLTIIFEDGYFRIMENRIFFSEKEAVAAGKKRIKPIKGASCYAKQYGPSLHMIQFGAYREFYGAWKKKRDIESAGR